MSVTLTVDDAVNMLLEKEPGVLVACEGTIGFMPLNGRHPSDILPALYGYQLDMIGLVSGGALRLLSDQNPLGAVDGERVITAVAVDRQGHLASKTFYSGGVITQNVDGQMLEELIAVLVSAEVA